MQMMPLTTQSMIQSAHNLGGLVDDVLSTDSKHSKKLSDSDIKALNDISLLSKAIVSAVNAKSYSLLGALLASTPAGFVAAKAIDTNENPSNFKTIGALLTGSIITGATMKLLNALIGQSQSEENANILIEALVDDAESGLKHLVTRNLITQNTANTMLADINKAQAANNKINNVAGAVYGIESLFTAYHGYKRNNDSIGYGLAWWLTSGMGLGVALEQGYAKPLNQ